MVKVIVVLVIVVKRVFSLAKTIVVDVIVIYIPRIPVVFFVMGKHVGHTIDISSRYPIVVYTRDYVVVGHLVIVVVVVVVVAVVD